MPDSTAMLSDLRRQIDEIDDSIHDLLIKRSELVGRIAAAKGVSSGVSPLRPAREALVLRRLVSRHKGSFPVAALVRIWREIMCAMSSLQGGLSVVVSDGERCEGLLELAQNHFGTVLSITPMAGPGAVLRALADQPSVVGVMPMPDMEDPDPWWVHLVSEDERTPRILARLPFKSGRVGNQKAALVIGHAPSEPTGDDSSFIALESTQDVSRTRLVSRVSQVGLTAVQAMSFDDPGRNANLARLNLIEVKDFVGEGDPRLAMIGSDASDGVGRAFLLGSCATPLTPGLDPAATRTR
jgi:chorismate mutase/prephenate dehydratase